MKRNLKQASAVFILLITVVCLACSQSIEGGGPFEQQNIDIADYGLFDLGVADMNADDRLDVFTANHSALQSILLNDGHGGFDDVYSPWHLHQAPDFPELSIFPTEIPVNRTGVYINWHGPDVVVSTHGAGKNLSVEGRIEVFTSVEVLKKEALDVVVTEKSVSPLVAHTTIDFSSLGKGFFRFRPFNHALPFTFHLSGDIAPEKIFVGPRMINPQANDFTFLLRDRHGMAWADFNADERMDVFITRGGERGRMGKLPMSFWDELFMGTADGMKDVGILAGLEKMGCPGRQAGLIDFNNDNLLDIYISCGRGFDHFSNLLFQQTADGHFKDVATEIGLDIRTVGSFVWLDIDMDTDMDLVWAGPDGHFLYRNDGAQFMPIPLESFNRDSFTRKLTVADYDNDGDLDIFSAAAEGNVLFVNANGDFSAVLPRSVGLPDKSFTANWVDVDNDGGMELHAVPQGVFGQQPDGTFSASSLLQLSPKRFSPFQSVGAISAWFDADNSGTRDLLLATQFKTKPKKWARWMVTNFKLDRSFGGLGYYWKEHFFSNRDTTNHWLQVQLKGPAGNHPAIGATVMLQTDKWKQLQQVGCADGSHLSMGHYRLYFGLGRDPQEISLQVNWPDGKTTRIVDPQLDQLLKIDWQNA